MKRFLLLPVLLFLLIPTSSQAGLRDYMDNLCRTYDSQLISGLNGFPNNFNLGVQSGKRPFKYSKTLLIYHSNAINRLYDRLCYNSGNLSDTEVSSIISQIELQALLDENIRIITRSSKAKPRKSYSVGKRLGSTAPARLQVVFENYGREGYVAVYRFYRLSRVATVEFNFYKRNLSYACQSSRKTFSKLRLGYRRVALAIPSCSRLIREYKKGSRAGKGGGQTIVIKNIRIR